MATWHPAYVLRRKGSEEWINDIGYFVACARFEINVPEDQQFQLSGIRKAPTSGKMQGQQLELGNDSE